MDFLFYFLYIANNYTASNIDRKACLNALIELRRYEWFKVRLSINSTL